MSFELKAPEQIFVGAPIVFSYSSDNRVSGRLRLTAGTEAVMFRLQKEGADAGEPDAGPRVRGKSGTFAISDWGQHEVGAELVLRFEGRKVWMKVTDQ